MNADFSDRVRGCILAGAIGDAMGGPYEGRPGPIEYRPRAPWAISDDTQMTIATCESIIENGRVSPEHVASGLVKWHRRRRISGMGSSTLKALQELEAGAHWALAGAKGEMSAGSGAAMRVAPLAFFLDPDDDSDRQLLRDVCRITHHNDEAYIGGLAIVVAIRLMSVDDREAPRRLLEEVAKRLPDSRVRDRILRTSKLPEGASIAAAGRQFGSTGYVVDSVPLALFAARCISRFPLEDLIRQAIEVGGDTDTIASITGQIAGSWLGASKIPPNLIASLPDHDQIEAGAMQFAKIVSQL